MKSTQLIAVVAVLLSWHRAVAQSSFTKITEGPVVTDRGVSPLGPAWGDLNNDGYLDLVIGDEGRWGSTNDYTRAVPMIYLNNRDGTFRRATVRDIGPPASTAIVGLGPITLTDYDNDGYLDVYMYEGVERNPEKVAYLYRGGPDGKFTVVSQDVGINRPLGPWLSYGWYPYPWAVSWVDYDQDGFLDVYLTTAWTHDSTVDQLWRNNGDGTFSRVLTDVFNVVFDSQFACWADYDGDGDPDVFVGGLSGTGRFYRNDGNRQFTDLTDSLGLTLGWYGAWGDYDNDGRLDLHAQTGLFWNDGAGNFIAQTGSAYPGRGPATWIDYDNDGYLDYFTPYYQETNRRCLMRNNRDGTFTEVSLGGLTDDAATWGMPAWADYDNDGFLDVVVCNRASNKPNDLYHNNGNAHHWLLVKLVGTASNRSAIGAKVRVRATIWGGNVQQMRETSGTPFAGNLRTHFGLGDASQVDLLRIEWPSGIVQTLTNVAPNQILTVTEYQAGATSAPSLTASRPANGAVQLTAAGQTNLRYVFETSTNLAQWTKIAVRTNLTGSADFTDVTATNYTQRFYRAVVP